MVSISLVDFIGKVDDGVGVILSFCVDEKVYEMMYWFNMYDKNVLVVEDSFYVDYKGIKDIMEFSKINDLLEYINLKVLPSRKEIFEKYLIN